MSTIVDADDQFIYINDNKGKLTKRSIVSSDSSSALAEADSALATANTASTDAATALSSIPKSFSQLTGLVTQDQLSTPTPNWFNVKKYGAVGDAKTVRDVVTVSNSKTVSSATAQWTQSDVGKIIWIIGLGLPVTGGGNGITTIDTVISSTSVILHDAVLNGAGGSGQICVWATQDDTQAFKDVVAAAVGTSSSSTSKETSQGPNLTQPKTIYIPTGGYVISDSFYNEVTGQNYTLVPSIVGEDWQTTLLYPSPSLPVNSPNGNMIRVSTGSGFRFENFSIAGSSQLMHNISIGSMVTVSACDKFSLKRICITDVGFDSGSGQAILNIATSNNYSVDQVFIQGGAAGAQDTAVVLSTGAGVATFRDCTFSNFFKNLVISSCGGRNPNSSSLIFLNCFIDECGSQYSTSILDSNVIFVGTQFNQGNIFGAGQAAIFVDTTSTAWFQNIRAGAFNSLGNIHALVMDNGAIVSSSQSTWQGNGVSGVCVIGTGKGSGAPSFIDAGGNQYQHTTGTSVSLATIGQSFSGVVPSILTAPGASHITFSTVAADIVGSVILSSGSKSVVYSNAYSSTPIVLLTPTGTDAVRLSVSSNTGFTIASANGADSQAVNYMVIGNPN